MECIIILAVSIVTIILMKIGLNIHIKDIKRIKEIGYSKSLNEIADKFPENKEICNSILSKLGNDNVQIEENDETKTSLYIAVTNKIIIAKIKDTFTRIQTIAHECLHSVQNRKILMFNFAFSNIFIIAFIAFLVLILFNIGNSMVYLTSYAVLTIIYITIRGYLENEAMSKAIYVAKEYMESYAKDKENITEQDIQKIVENYDELNKVGIPLTNFWLVAGCMIKLAILVVVTIF